MSRHFPGRNGEGGGSVHAMSNRPANLGQLRDSGWESLPVKEEIRRNAIARIRAGEPLVEAVLGYEHTVLPQLENAILAGHDVIFLGERGQAKTRMIRSLTGLPDGASLVEFGHWGDGGLHANLVVPHAATGGRPPHPETIAGLRRRIWAVVAGLGGSWASEHGWGPTNDDALAAHGDPVRIDLLDRIEAMLDPQDILGRPRHP